MHENAHELDESDYETTTKTPRRKKNDMRENLIFRIFTNSGKVEIGFNMLQSSGGAQKSKKFSFLIEPKFFLFLMRSEEKRTFHLGSI